MKYANCFSNYKNAPANSKLRRIKCYLFSIHSNADESHDAMNYGEGKHEPGQSIQRHCRDVKHQRHPIDSSTSRARGIFKPANCQLNDFRKLPVTPGSGFVPPPPLSISSKPVIRKCSNDITQN